MENMQVTVRGRLERKKMKRNLREQIRLDRILNTTYLDHSFSFYSELVLVCHRNKKILEELLFDQSNIIRKFTMCLY